MLLALAETLAIIAIVILLSYYVKYFYIAVIITQVVCVLSIIGRSDNPDYKVPWLFVVLVLPVVGFMLYFMFYSRKLNSRQIKRLRQIANQSVVYNDEDSLRQLYGTDKTAAGQAAYLLSSSRTHVYNNQNVIYFKSGENMYKSMLADLQNAQKFIFLEYFIIQKGVFWNSILDILKQKVKQGVEVRVVYDDIGCMTTLPSLYYKTLQKYGIKAVPFAILKGDATGEFNNRSHRKIMVIDGVVGYTGGINIADEYINERIRFGHWKDGGIKITGRPVQELTNLFLTDYEFNNRKQLETFAPYFEASSEPCLADNNSAHAESQNDGFVVPFGDGPVPIYEQNVAKTAFLNIINQAQTSVQITTPYLIIDNELANALENAAGRGVNVQIITPHVPDKKFIQLMSRSYYPRLIKRGVKIYEYLPGFIHAKTIVGDNKYAIVGTINLDYRSFVHHFEDGVWMFGCSAINDITCDITKTLGLCKQISMADCRQGVIKRFICSIMRIFAPLL